MLANNAVVTKRISYDTRKTIKEYGSNNIIIENSVKYKTSRRVANILSR